MGGVISAVRSTPRLRRSAAAWACAVAAFAHVEPARADTFGAELHYVWGTTHIHGTELSPAAGVPEADPLEGKHPRIWGQGTFDGVGLRADLLLDKTRLGAGVSLYAIDDVTVVTDLLDGPVRARPYSIWGDTTEIYLGYEFLQGPVYAYFDLRGTFSLLMVQLETHVEPYGHVGTSQYNAYRFGFAPRVGALLPVGHSTMLDFGISQRIAGGVEETLFYVGVGYWENDRRDEFSEELRGSWRGDF